MKFITTDGLNNQFCSISCARACGYDTTELQNVDGYLSACPGCIEMPVENMQESKKFLQCYSKGDRRFSALYARLGCGKGKTIERYYQSTKRDGYGKPFTHPEWNPGYRHKAAYLFLNGHLVSNTGTLQHQFYTMLWMLYLLENPDLYNLACTYDGFYEKDMTEIWTPSDQLPYHRGCNQAASIAYLVYVGRKQRTLEVAYQGWNPEVIASSQKYWGIYPNLAQA